MSTERIEISASPEVIAGWQSHFDEGISDDKDALTAAELAELEGRSIRSMQVRLRKGLRKGEYAIHQVRRTDLIGRVQIVPGYKLVKKKQTKRRGR